MKKNLLKYIICPKCRHNLKLKSFEVVKDEIKKGEIICRKCKSVYMINNYVPRFVKSDNYVNSFSLEWRKHKTTQLDSFHNRDEAKKLFFQHTGFNKKELKNRLVLDVGCGIGRFSEVVANSEGEIIGIDLSYSVDSAFKNIGLNKNVHIIQADIFNLPFKNNLFDYIFSIGVLHHTPDTKKAFLKLPILLKTGGKISIAVYSNEGFKSKIGNNVSEIIRFFTTRMEKKKLYQKCKKITKFLLYIRRLLIINSFIRFLPLKPNHSLEYNTLELFDWLSPKFQRYHTYQEVKSWFEEAKLINVKKNITRVSVQGKK